MIEKSLATFLDELAAKTSAPGGGAVAALSVAMAAGLVGMAARFSVKTLGEEAHTLAARADALRAEGGLLAQADAEAYSGYLEARRLAEDDPGREAAIAAAESRAAEVPLRIAEVGAEVSRLAEELGERGNPNLAGDAYAAGVVAQAGTRAAANLVLVNVREDADGRVRRARELAGKASDAAARAVAADAGPEPKP